MAVSVAPRVGQDSVHETDDVLLLFLGFFQFTVLGTLIRRLHRRKHA